MNLSSVLKKHFYNIFILSLLIISLGLSSYLTTLNHYLNNVVVQQDNNIKEYNEVDREQLCKISNCDKIYIPKEHITVSPKGKYYKEDIKFYKISNNIFLDRDFNIYIKSNLDSTLYRVELHKALKDLKRNLLTITMIGFILMLIPFYKVIRKEQETQLAEQASKEALLMNKSMIMITENIHHELNTPLEVLDNKVEKIHNLLVQTMKEAKERWEHNLGKTLSEDDYKKKEKRNLMKNIIDAEKDFEYIKSASEQIYAVLEKMKGFKHLRYSNGNKSIYDIVLGAVKTLSISNSNFEFKIDKALKKYSLKHDSIKNADLLSIMINHIKNSLEANSNKIYIILSSEDKNFVKIRIIDNGKGIPKEFQKNIFKPNFSTKNTKEEIRGNGMYLNKHILTTSGGGIKLIDSSSKGTTIELKIPSYLRKRN